MPAHTVGDMGARERGSYQAHTSSTAAATEVPAANSGSLLQQ